VRGSEEVGAIAFIKKYYSLLSGQKDKYSNIHKNKIQVSVKVAGFKARKWLWILSRAFLIIGISFIIVYPLIIKLSVALMSQQDLYDLTVKWVPKHPVLDNFKMAINAMNYTAAFKNTAFLTFLVTFLQLAVCTMASYSFARLKFPFSKMLFWLMVFSLIVPPQTIMISTYSEFRFFDPFSLTTILTGKQGLIGTMWPFIIKAVLGQGIRNGLFIYILTNFFRQIPLEIEEAAHIDGAGSYKTFFTIMLPNAVPAIVTVCVFSVVWQWNDNFYCNLLAPGMDFLSTNLFNVDKLMRSAQSQIYSSSPEIISAAKNAVALLIVAPMIVLFIFVQRYFVENLERSGIVG
jgi:multiple sugar transport system permease protein